MAFHALQNMNDTIESYYKSCNEVEQDLLKIFAECFEKGNQDGSIRKDIESEPAAIMLKSQVLGLIEALLKLERKDTPELVEKVFKQSVDVVILGLKGQSYH